ncbi:PIN domain nuclease, partial [Candidatus Collierbacteria bacterium CG10_big_fil_rev_8_21_14_0_10_44_9]
KIIRLAKYYHGRLMTVDYNLNRVAQIQNLIVLNVNELNNALRPVVLPGERLKIRIIQAGKDAGQGVGYLEDGTMVVVEGGDSGIGREREVVVTRVFQTVAGKMIFAMLEEKYQ